MSDDEARAAMRTALLNTAALLKTYDVERTHGIWAQIEAALAGDWVSRAESQQHFDAAVAMRALLDASEKENRRLRAELESVTAEFMNRTP